jgi:hypothetical protein
LAQHETASVKHLDKKKPIDKKLVKVNRTKAKKRFNLHLAHKPSDATDLLISAVNEADLGWKADVCKYQKTHPNYGKNCDEEALLIQTSEKDDDDGMQSLDQEA